MAPPIGARFCTVVFFWSGGIMYIWPMYTWRESAGVLHVTGSLLHTVLACRLAELSGCSSPNYLLVPQSTMTHCHCLRHVLDSNCQTLSQDRCLDTMATGTSLPGVYRTGNDFQVNVQIPWNAPEAYVTLYSPGLSMLNTSLIPDVLRLRTRYP